MPLFSAAPTCTGVYKANGFKVLTHVRIRSAQYLRAVLSEGWAAADVRHIGCVDFLKPIAEFLNLLSRTRLLCQFFDTNSFVTHHVGIFSKTYRHFYHFRVKLSGPFFIVVSVSVRLSGFENVSLWPLSQVWALREFCMSHLCAVNVATGAPGTLRH